MNIAIITGASSGIGWEFAGRLDSLLKKTDEIWLLARRKDKLDELSAQMKIKTRAIAMDLTSEKELVQFAEVLPMQKLPSSSTVRVRESTALFAGWPAAR